MDYAKVRDISYKMGIGEYYRYLPLLFTYRTINAKKPLGGEYTPEERQFIVGNDEVNFEKMSFLMQRLPTEIIFIFKAMHIVGMHNRRNGGNTRDRLFTFSKHAVRALQKDHFLPYRIYIKLSYWLRLFLFEKAFWLFNKIYGFMDLKFDAQNRLVEEAANSQMAAI